MQSWGLHVVVVHGKISLAVIHAIKVCTVVFANGVLIPQMAALHGLRALIVCGKHKPILNIFCKHEASYSKVCNDIVLLWGRFCSHSCKTWLNTTPPCIFLEGNDCFQYNSVFVIGITNCIGKLPLVIKNSPPESVTLRVTVHSFSFFAESVSSGCIVSTLLCWS